MNKIKNLTIIIAIILIASVVLLLSVYQNEMNMHRLNNTAHQAVVIMHKDTGKVALVLYDAANDKEIIYWMDYQRTDPSGIKYYYFD